MSASYVRHELPLFERDLMVRKYEQEHGQSEEAEDPEDFTRPPKELSALGH